jgi:hypothetical protein
MVSNHGFIATVQNDPINIYNFRLFIKIDFSLTSTEKQDLVVSKNPMGRGFQVNARPKTRCGTPMLGSIATPNPEASGLLGHSATIPPKSSVVVSQYTTQKKPTFSDRLATNISFIKNDIPRSPTHDVESKECR